MRTCVVRAVREDHIDVLELETAQGLLRAFDDASAESVLRNRRPNNEYTYCLRERPMSLGPLRVPQKSFVVTMTSERRMLSSLITRPLNVVNPCQPLREGFESRTMN